MSVRALAKGSECPKQTGKLRLYSNRFCPYAIRTALVLNFKQIKYDTVNVNLTDKPDWLFEKNPLGKVPVLEFGDKILLDSLIICDYLDDVYPDNPLRPRDAYERARERLWLELFNKVANQIVVLTFKNSSKDKKESWDEILHELRFWEKQLNERGTPFFCGDKPGMFDFMAWPLLRVLPVTVAVIPSLVPVSEVKDLSKVNAWFTRMKGEPVVQQTMLSFKQPIDSIEYYVQFAQSFITGKPNYDVGL